MPAFFIDSRDIHGESITITGELLHHLRASLRVQPNETLHLTDERRRRHHAVVTGLTREHLMARILTTVNGPLLSPVLILGQAILKGDHMDWIMQKAAELGAKQIVPLVTHRSVVRPHLHRVPAQTARWQRIAREAAQQSEQWQVPAVAAPREFREFLVQSAGAVRLILVERTQGNRLTEIPMPGQAPTVTIAVGPEGGWLADEVTMAVDQGFEPISLGTIILRSETAALTALAVLQSRLGELG